MSNEHHVVSEFSGAQLRCLHCSLLVLVACSLWLQISHSIGLVYNLPLLIEQKLPGSWAWEHAEGV